MKESTTVESLAKLMTPGGEWKGLGPDERYYNGTTPDTSPTGGALIVNSKKNWPVAVVKPTVLRPISLNGTMDVTSVVYNAFTPESGENHVKISSLKQMSAGSENELRLLNIRNDHYLKAKVQENLKQAGLRGYTTWEVAADMMEANREVVQSVSLVRIEETVRRQNEVIIQTIKRENLINGTEGKVLMVSSRPNLDTEVGPPEDVYITAMVALLAQRGMLNTDNTGVLSWMAHTSHKMLDNLTPLEIAVRIKSGDEKFSEKGIIEFDASAIHAHVGMTNPADANPNFYAAFLNYEMGVLGPMLAVPTFSGPFRNGTYSMAHEIKQFTRPWFITSGYQASYKEMGTAEHLEEVHANITTGAASSLSRAGVTGDKSHGETRIRTEPFRTAERLYASAHPLAETEAAFVISGHINAAILSHYHQVGLKIDLLQSATRYFSGPDEVRYNINRQQIGAHGQFARIIDGDGNVTDYKDFIMGYAAFVKEQVDTLGIETSTYTRADGTEVDEVHEFANRLRKVVEVPEHGWNIDNYMDVHHPDYAKGTLSTHLIAELAVRITGEEKWRTSYKTENGEWVNFSDYESARKWWKNITREIPEGRYDDEIKDITDKLADLTHARYSL